MTRIPLLGLLLLAVIVTAPAAATVVLSSSTYIPDSPFVPGSQEHVVAQYAIIPSGATTFAKDHEIQMQTDLIDAQWSIQVTQNGRDAAQQNAQGSAAFINGAILSYTTNNDVGFIVTIDGKVPQDATSPFMVLTAEEIDNSGNVVPGSIITLTQPIAGQSPEGGAPVIPSLTPQIVQPDQVPTAKSPGFAVLSASGACALAFSLLGRKIP